MAQERVCWCVKTHGAPHAHAHGALAQHTVHSLSTRSIRLAHTQGPVLVRGLGRFLELKALAARQAADAAAVRARVFLERPGPPRAAATVPVPFKLGRGGAGGAGGAGGGGDGGDDVRQRPAAAGDVECTFRPAISSRHVSRQQRVRQLLDAPLQ